MAKLPPGFRFSPTDVELIMYYLKRKIMGKKLLFEAVSELNIYKFSPWDLPDKCCYKSKDLEWYFFCPRERKYASGARMNRATETGYWKTTGKDRSVLYDEKIVGSVKTLVFHQGHAPRGQRTDWVLHEYRFEDKNLADAGVPLDAYVLCKVFQKSGPGPKNGAQYGAPYKEEEWEEDEAPAEHNASSSTCMVDPGSACGCPFNELDPSSTQPSVYSIPAEPNLSAVSPSSALPDNMSYSVTAMVDPGNKSLWHLTKSGQSFAKLCSREMPQDKEDDIIHLLDMFTEDPDIYSAGNKNNLSLNNLEQGRNVEAAPFTDGNDIYSGLGNLDNYAELDPTAFDISVTQRTDYSHNPIFLQDVPYLELNDLDIPLSHSAETIDMTQILMGNFCAPHDSDLDMNQFCFGGDSSVSSKQIVGQHQLHVLPEHYIQQVSHSDSVNYGVTNVNQGYNAVNTADLSSYKQPEDNRYAAQNQERGEQQGKFFSSMFCAGFSKHVKAEVILWFDGCTNDALSTGLGDPSSVFIPQSTVDKADKEVIDYCYDLTTAPTFGISLAFLFVSRIRFVAQFLLGVYFGNSILFIET